MNKANEGTGTAKGYRALTGNAYGRLSRGGISGALGLSILLHGLLLGLPMVLLAGVPTKKRELRLASASTKSPSFNLTLKTHRPPTPPAAKGKKASDGGGQKKKVARFNSDIVRRHARAILGNIIYPRMARRLGWEGRVRIRALVGPDGRVLSAKVADGSGYAVLDRAALTGVRKHRFDPGEGTETILLSLRFQLNDE